jgi:type II secretory pathway component PulF
MPTFRYHAKSAPGQTVDGVVEAENRLAALGKLSDLGYLSHARGGEYLAPQSHRCRAKSPKKI